MAPPLVRAELGRELSAVRYEPLITPWRDDDNPFVDATRVREMYADRGHLAQRSSSLLAAKEAGRDVNDVIVCLARDHLRWERDSVARPNASRQILDVGCGRGSSSVALTGAFPDANVALADLSHDLLVVARDRVNARHPDAQTATMQGDFHQLPLQDGSVDLIVAAFCLYHSCRPEHVIAEFARCLRPAHPREHAVIVVTKSADSYHELDELVARAGLDQRAAERPSLYQSAHSANLASIVASKLTVREVVHDRNSFRFSDLEHVARYVATVPKYQLPIRLVGRPDKIAQALRSAGPDRAIVATSTITYVLATQAPPTDEGGPPPELVEST